MTKGVRLTRHTRGGATRLPAPWEVPGSPSPQLHSLAVGGGLGKGGGQCPNCPSTSLILINQGLAARTRKPPPHKEHLWKWSRAWGWRRPAGWAGPGASGSHVGSFPLEPRIVGAGHGVPSVHVAVHAHGDALLQAGRARGSARVPLRRAPPNPRQHSDCIPQVVRARTQEPLAGPRPPTTPRVSPAPNCPGSPPASRCTSGSTCPSSSVGTREPSAATPAPWKTRPPWAPVPVSAPDLQ